jgi:hypothetical protein
MLQSPLSCVSPPCISSFLLYILDDEQRWFYRIERAVRADALIATLIYRGTPFFF